MTTAACSHPGTSHTGGNTALEQAKYRDVNADPILDPSTYGLQGAPVAHLPTAASTTTDSTNTMLVGLPRGDDLRIRFRQLIAALQKHGVVITNTDCKTGTAYSLVGTTAVSSSWKAHQPWLGSVVAGVSTEEAGTFGGIHPPSMKVYLSVPSGDALPIPTSHPTVSNCT